MAEPAFRATSPLNIQRFHEVNQDQVGLYFTTNELEAGEILDTAQLQELLDQMKTDPAGYEEWAKTATFVACHGCMKYDKSVETIAGFANGERPLEELLVVAGEQFIKATESRNRIGEQWLGLKNQVQGLKSDDGLERTQDLMASGRKILGIGQLMAGAHREATRIQNLWRIAYSTLLEELQSLGPNAQLPQDLMARVSDLDIRLKQSRDPKELSKEDLDGLTPQPLDAIKSRVSNKEQGMQDACTAWVKTLRSGTELRIRQTSHDSKSPRKGPMVSESIPTPGMLPHETSHTHTMRVSGMIAHLFTNAQQTFGELHGSDLKALRVLQQKFLAKVMMEYRNAQAANVDAV